MPRYRSYADIASIISLGICYTASRAWPTAQAVCAVGGIFTCVVMLAIEIHGGFRGFRALGVRTDNLKDSFQFSTLVLGPFLAAAIAYAIWHGIYRPQHFALALLIYPVWGLIQQTAFQGVLLGALNRLNFRYWGVLITNLVFVAVHYPSKFLLIFTAIGGPFFSLIYFKRPNVLPLALYHGVFGAFLYYVFREKDLVGSLLGNI